MTCNLCNNTGILTERVRGYAYGDDHNRSGTCSCIYGLTRNDAEIRAQEEWIEQHARDLEASWSDMSRAYDIVHGVPERFRGADNVA